MDISFFYKRRKKINISDVCICYVCFRLIKMVMKILMSIIEKFWWRSKGNVKGMYCIYMKKCVGIKKMED